MMLLRSTASISAAGLPPEAAAARADRHLSTLHLAADLRGRSVRGGAITLGSQALKFVLQTGSLVVLARLLTPRDYGLIGMATVVTGFIAIFKDLGLSQATIQREQVTQRQVSVLFWVNVLAGLVLVGITAAVAPLAAWFYGEPRLTPIMLALSVTFVFGGLSAQHYALLRRQMRFTAVAIVDVVSMACGVAAGIAAAVAGAGYWSLVVLTVATVASAAVLTWCLSPWRPDLPRRGSNVREMLAFGGNLTGFNIVNYFSRNADNLLIGWYWGASPLGLYSKAYHLLTLPLQQLIAPISSVVVPALSRLQDQPERYRSYYRQALLPLMGAVFPLIVFATLQAPELVLLVLGEKWLPVADVFIYLSPAALIGATYAATGWVYVSLGRADRQLRWGLLAATLTVAGFAISLPWGIEAVAASFSIVSVALRYPGVVYCFRGTPVRTMDLLGVTWRPALSSATAGLAMWAVERASGLESAVLVLLLGAVVFMITYAAAWTLLPGGRRSVRELSATAALLRPARNERAQA